MAAGLCELARRALLPALLVGAVWPTSGEAAPISWANRSAFEACLESRLNAWLQAQAELVVNEDPASRRLDDATVATWTIEALSACRAQAGSAREESEDRFMRHMARWRQHIYDVASGIRQKGASD